MRRINRIHRLGRALSLIVLAVILSAGAPARGQHEEPGAQPGPGSIEEIVVLGCRARVETLASELPVGVDLFQGEELERAGEADLGAALTKLAPSLNYSRQSIGDMGELYAFGGLSRREGRASGAYRFRHNYWEGLESGDDTWDFVVPNFINFHERNTHPVYPNGFLPYEESRIDDVSAVAGWRGNVSDWDLDLSAAYGRNEYRFGVTDTINASVGAHYLDRNPDATVAEIIANAGPLEGSSGGIEFDQLTLNFDVRGTFDGSLLSALAAGLEHRMENYRQIAGDEASWSCGLPHAEDYGAFAVGPGGAPLVGTVAACGFQGYPGYSPRNAELSDDDRNNQGAYVEVELQPSDNLSISAALRAENYSDAGSQTTGKLAARFDLGGGFALRGAQSTGFRAPSLSQRRFNSILFVGSETGLTTVFAVNEGHSVARAFGVDSLDHETSENLSAGLVLSLDDVTFSIDAYRTNIEDRVVRSRGIGCAGIAACDAARVGTAAFIYNNPTTPYLCCQVVQRMGSTSIPPGKTSDTTPKSGFSMKSSDAISSRISHRAGMKRKGE